jgi:hypothetical protein
MNLGETHKLVPSGASVCATAAYLLRVRLIAFCSSAVNSTFIAGPSFGALDFGLNLSKMFTPLSVHYFDWQSRTLALP